MKKFIKGLLVLIVILFIGISGTLGYIGYYRYKKEIQRKPISEVVLEYTSKDDYVDFNDIDEDFVNAVVSVEDKRFFERKGYDYVAFIRAMRNNFILKSFVEGGSTISEQIAKNLYLNGQVRAIEEKIAEIFIMLDLEKQYSKEELFALYANMNYYGDAYWGIKQASSGYYDKECDDLSLAQAAILAGIPNAPAVYQLSSGYDLAKNRQEKVLKSMLNNGYISQEELEQALLEDVHPIK